MESLKDLLLKADEISIVIEKEFTVVYDVSICTKLNGMRKSRANWTLTMKQDLAHLYKKSMRLRWNTMMWLLNMCQNLYQKWNFYQKHRGDLLVKIIGERRFSHDLNQGGIELPATYVYRSVDIDIHSKLLTFVGETMEVYNKAKKRPD